MNNFLVQTGSSVGSSHQKLDARQRLAAARNAAHPRGAPGEQAATRDLIESLDAGGRLGALLARLNAKIGPLEATQRLMDIAKNLENHALHSAWVLMRFNIGT